MTSNPYFRSFLAATLVFVCVAMTMISRHPGNWAAFPIRDLFVLVCPWIVTTLLIGTIATKWRACRSWLLVGATTVAGYFAVLSLMLVVVEKVYGLSPKPEFETVDEMMVYFANEATKWVKQDRSVDLNYTIQSIEIVEQELARIAKEVDKSNPQAGTFGTALTYGAYIGEVIRRRDGGSWALDHAVAGERSYPLIVGTNTVIFPVTWAWKRLTEGEEENVFLKVQMLAQSERLFPTSSK